MGPRPTPKHSLDRIDNDGPYSPENCRWATHEEQARNKSNTRTVEWNGESRSIADLAEEHNIDNHTVKIRLKRGWTLEEALTKKKEPFMPDTVAEKMELLSPEQNGLLDQVGQAQIVLDNAKLAYGRIVRQANEAGISFAMMSIRCGGVRKETIWRRYQSYLKNR